MNLSFHNFYQIHNFEAFESATCVVEKDRLNNQMYKQFDCVCEVIQVRKGRFINLGAGRPMRTGLF